MKLKLEKNKKMKVQKLVKKVPGTSLCVQFISRRHAHRRARAHYSSMK